MEVLSLATLESLTADTAVAVRTVPSTVRLEQPSGGAGFHELRWTNGHVKIM